MSIEPAAQPRHRRRSSPAWIAVSLAVVAGLGALIAFGRSQGNSSPGVFKPFSSPPSNCSASGCAVADATLQSPTVTLYHGASCTGERGVWFLNAIGRGGEATVYPSYALHFSLVSGTTARPDGNILVPASAPNHVALALKAGSMTIVGTTPAGQHVSARGTITVELIQEPAGTTLTIQELGLTEAEKALGIYSPFNVDGKPTTLQVKTVAQLAGC